MFSRVSAPNYIEMLNWYVDQRVSGSEDIPMFPLRDAWRTEVEGA